MQFAFVRHPRTEYVCDPAVGVIVRRPYSGTASVPDVVGHCVTQMRPRSVDPSHRFKVSTLPAAFAGTVATTAEKSTSMTVAPSYVRAASVTIACAPASVVAVIEKVVASSAASSSPVIVREVGGESVTERV